MNSPDSPTKEQRASFIAALERWQRENKLGDQQAARILEVSHLRFLQWLNGSLVPTREELERVLASVAPLNNKAEPQR